MRPFFSYYGAKWTAAKYYGPPRRQVVIEPFAGSACYSTRWGVKGAKLYDVSEDICTLWDFLIHCSERDISGIPDAFEDYNDVTVLPYAAQILVRFWIAKGRATPSGTLSPWYFQWRHTQDCRVWGPSVKQRILAQKEYIRGWSIECTPWTQIPVSEAHWHVDPPYSGKPGRSYPHSDVDYGSLSKWCLNLPGAVDVCENVGATWLPFSPLCEVVSSRGRRDGARSREVVWSRDA